MKCIQKKPKIQKVSGLWAGAARFQRNAVCCGVPVFVCKSVPLRPWLWQRTRRAGGGLVPPCSTHLPVPCAQPGMLATVQPGRLYVLGLWWRDIWIPSVNCARVCFVGVPTAPSFGIGNKKKIDFRCPVSAVLSPGLDVSLIKGQLSRSISQSL